MKSSHRELLICLLLSGIFTLISFVLVWMPSLMTLLSILLSIGFLFAGLLVVLREHSKIRIIRMVSLATGLLLLFMSLVSSMPPENVRKELLSVPILIGFSLFPWGLALSAFGLFMDVWLSRLFRVSQWKVYRYVVNLCCISMALAPILALIVNNPVRDLGRDLQIIRPVLSLIILSAYLFYISEKHLQDR